MMSHNLKCEEEEQTMSENFAKHLIQQRNEFSKHLNNDINKTNEIITKIQQQINDYNHTINNINVLHNKIEHTALIPLGKRIYVDGIIKHTNEYYLDQLSYPNSYTIELTSQNIIKLLLERIKQQQQILEKYQQSNQQLIKRMELFKSDNNQFVINQDLPEEIVSDRGVAVRIGEFYEILEFEE